VKHIHDFKPTSRVVLETPSRILYGPGTDRCDCGEEDFRTLFDKLSAVDRPGRVEG
jgi:hypothetical protein